jgi:hypothetical protein
MLPAPRDPRAPEAVPPDPPPAPPPEPPPLEPQLTTLMRSAGAQALRAVDGASGEVLAAVGLAAGDDVAALVQLARAAKALGRGRGEWAEDVVVTLGRTVHVLRECEGVVLHARIDPTRGDVGAVRRALGADGVRRAAAAAGRTPVRPEPAGPGARVGSRGPAHAAAPRPVAEPPVPRPAPPAPPRHGERPGNRPGGGNVWPYSVREDAAPAAPSPSPREPRPAAPRPVDAGPAVPARAVEATGPGMRPVVPQPRPASPPPPPLPIPPRRRPVPQQVSLPVPQQVSQQVSQPVRRPSPQVRPTRLPEPPPVPLPRHALRPDPDGRDPALVTVDGGSPVTSSGALAVLALPPVAGLPRRRRAVPVQQTSGPRVLVTPAVLRQPWASDVDTMQRLLARLYRMS